MYRKCMEETTEEKTYDKLVKTYKDNYKLDLVGENLLQFHVDFPTKDGYKEVYSIEGLFLGKKSYFDLL